MPRLVYLDSALHDLADIATHVEASTGSREAALASIARLMQHCERIAGLPGLLGRRRPELRPDCRSIAAGSYLVFFRYLDEGGPRAVLEVIRFPGRSLPGIVSKPARRLSEAEIRIAKRSNGFRMIHVLHGARDLKAFFRRTDGER